MSEADATPRFEMMPSGPLGVRVIEWSGALARVEIEGSVLASGWVERAALRAFVRRPAAMWQTPRRVHRVATLLPGAVVAEEERRGGQVRVRYLDPDGQVETTGWVDEGVLTGEQMSQARLSDPVPPAGRRLATRRPLELLASPEGGTLAHLGSATPVWVGEGPGAGVVAAVVARPGLMLRGFIAPADLEPEREDVPRGRAHAQGFGDIPMGEVVTTLEPLSEIRASPDGPVLVRLPKVALLEQLDRDATEAWIHVRTLHEVCVYGWIRASDVMALVP